MPRKATGKRSVMSDGKVVVNGKSANGQDSVYREPDGTWRATYVVAGKRKKVRGRTQKEAIDRRDEKVAEIERSGKLVRFTTSTTVLELAEWWLDNVEAHRVRESSLGKMRARLSPERLGDLAAVPVRLLAAEQVIGWQSWLLAERKLAPSTVGDCRTALRQVIGAAIDVGLVDVNVVDRVPAPKVQRSPGRALTPDEIRRLLDRADRERYGAAIAMLFIQGWRVSEVLGLAWSDIDFDKGTAIVRRAVIYVDRQGSRLGPPKTAGAQGVHRLAPGVVERLKRWKALQAADRLKAGPLWHLQTYNGVDVDLVFTREDGSLVTRQQVDKALRKCAADVGLDGHRLGTHSGRRSVVTALYSAGVELGDVARHVGHSSPSTTAGYVTDLGQRPENTADVAARLLDAPLTQ